MTAAPVSGPLSPSKQIPYTTAHAAVRTRIAAYTELDEVRRELEQILGIADEDGNLLPDDTRVYGIDVFSKSAVEPTQPAPRYDTHTSWQRDEVAKKSTAPEALRNLAPVAVPPKPVAKPKPKPKTASGRPSRAKSADQRLPMGRPKTAECGTTAGYERHRREKTKTCAACRAVKTATNRKYYEKRNALRRAERAAAPAIRGLAPHGTINALRRHRRAGEPMCAECVAGQAARIARMGSQNGKAVCGSNAGYSAHKYAKTVACEPCRKAHAAYQRDRVEAKKNEEKAA